MPLAEGPGSAQPFGCLTAPMRAPMLAWTTGSARRTQVRASIEFRQPNRLAPAIAAWIHQPQRGAPSRVRLHHVTVVRDPSRPAADRRNRSAHAFAITPYHHRGTRCVHASPSPATGDHEPPLLLDERLRQLPRDRRRWPAGCLSRLRVPSPPELSHRAGGRHRRPGPTDATFRHETSRSSMIGRPKPPR